MKLLVIITVSQNLFSLYRDQFQYFKELGVDVTAIAADGPEHEMLRAQGIRTIKVPMVKRPSPFSDMKSLILIWSHMLVNRYDIVSISTPKASLLGALASFFSLHKNVVFTLRGRAYENETGFKRKFYTLIDKLICKISKKVFSISKELGNELITSGLINKEKLHLIGEGSSNGVDLTRFSKANIDEQTIHDLKKKLLIQNNTKVILYSGRIRKDKGIEELVQAFKILNKQYNEVILLIQGEEDHTDPLSANIIAEIKKNNNIIRAPWSFEVEKYFAIADIFAFPSYREGFGNVAIEASAMSLPVIAYNVMGCRESVVNSKTGLLVTPFLINDFADKLLLLLNDEPLRIRLGKQGRERIVDSFDSRYIWSQILQLYKSVAKN
ncbi:glycosyltransferase family 4 protein [Thalassotalea nanhaiensis]|uniref:Glycosyltransferase family 4 protein n=1 Tax=Thalassotalea nanhaiensis TaxID=3065648 RepID=A0ABY9TL74_9GAMM|nr:glycosyltransferase family 4 protein [Colwelliaceae bacterium SQ345]